MGEHDPRSPQVVRRETLVRGRRFDFEEVELRSPAGHISKRQHIRHPGAACVLPLREGTEGPALVMVRVYRAAFGEHLLELPAGTIEAGEEPAPCAARELVEETGFSAATLREIGRFYTSPGLSDEVMWAFLATDLTHVGQSLDEDELLHVEEIPLARALGMARAGGLKDGKTILTLLLADTLGLLGGSQP
ncbi:MAG TPA: NUDIX hydrolase [Phycisphaerales bacterium]|nr:NUDIX hydrolase [Phycisphaerales bacterium]